MGAAALLIARPIQAVTFNLIPDAGTPQFAIDGFNTAADFWSSRLADNITVNIGITSLGANILGETAVGLPRQVIRRSRMRWPPSAHRLMIFRPTLRCPPVPITTG